MKLTALILIVFAAPGLADIVVPTRTIRADATISEGDVTLHNGEHAQGFSRLGDVIGQEAKVVLYAGRPIMVDQIGPPAIVSRNQIVGLFINGGGLKIVTEARALERGGVGDIVRVMNLNSRATVVGQVQPDGTVEVTN